MKHLKVLCKHARVLWLTVELGLNLNADYCAAWRFSLCASLPHCAQDGNPSNVADKPGKCNSLLSPTAIEAPQLWKGATVHPAAPDSWFCKAPVLALWCLSEGVDLNCFVRAHRGETGEATGIIGLMLGCVRPSASPLIPLTHSLGLDAGL